MATGQQIGSATPSVGHADGAYEQIKAAIITGALAPGSKVSEPELAKRLGVSRTPVHQAVVRLQDEEWLEVSSRRGLTIAPLEAGAMREIYEVLIGLEGIAVASLAGRSPEDPIDAELAAANAKCEQALEQHDLMMWAEADNAFHRLLIESSGNSRLIRVGAMLEEHAHRARLLTVRFRPVPTQSNIDHANIASFIGKRDPVNARSELENHRKRGIDTLVPILEALNPVPTASFVRLGK
ncbi:GntR family transcriptional regulator [Rhodococcus sp. NPDC057529]|uniref:GntR family transcriptional regulator n=1 Tax=Rhodococcus sp. NPDC057529 TaxID=3346158 RepID=UPI00366F68F1